MKSVAVIGLGFGDEGKGLVTDYLCSQISNPLVVRFSGGQQAGHTVKIGDKKHVFSNFGSGSLRGYPSYWSGYCSVDPVGILNELHILKHLEISPKLYIDGDAPVTTPWDKYCNQQSQRDIKNGTCGVGVGQTFKREEDFYSLKFLDLLYPQVLENKLDAIEKYYSFDVKLAKKDFFQTCQEMALSDEVKLAFDNTLLEYDRVFEGSQGLLLDQHYGFFPHVTRSNIGPGAIRQMGYNPELYLVTRAYQTRHGAGPMTNEDIDHNIKDDPNETNGYNAWQGSFRKSILDLDLLHYSMMKDPYIRTGRHNLVITCLDHIEGSYRLTELGELQEFESEDEFVSKIANTLKVNKVFVSHGPESENIREFRA